VRGTAVKSPMLRWRVCSTHGEELILGLTLDFIAWPDVTFAMGMSDRPSAFDSDYHALFSSRRFEGLLTNRQWNLGEIVANIEQVEAATTQLIERLASRRALL
jgi:hypothetical protein